MREALGLIPAPKKKNKTKQTNKKKTSPQIEEALGNWITYPRGQPPISDEDMEEANDELRK
jgi:hypothetical protein